MQAEARLQHLEELVQLLAPAQNVSAANDFVSTNDRQDQSSQQISDWSNGNGNRCSPSEGLVYTGSTHWSAMLEDIEELKLSITSSDSIESTTRVREVSAVGIIFGSDATLSFEQVLAKYLPSRKDADRLTAAYFRGRAIHAPFIHPSQFRRLYTTFWSDPFHASPLWTSIFFSICHIASNTLTLGKDQSQYDFRYVAAAAHCLAIGEYYKPNRFAVEALLLFAQSKCITTLDIPVDTGLIFGPLIRLAITMGYHRDPDMFPLSVFEKEMRRRTWSLCMQLDLLVSFQLGLPSNIQFPTWDTRPPKNLLDSDFDESSTELPPSRPESELTDALFYIAKHRLMEIFEKILRHSLDARTEGPGNPDALDAEIRCIYAALPEILRPRPMADSVVDSSSLVVTRICVDFIYQKSLCVLHRSYVTQGRRKSIQVCYEAAFHIVRDFTDVYVELLPGGQAETERWFLGSITWHDFLLGAISLCLVLCATSENSDGVDVDRTECLRLLGRARDICNEQSVRSKGTEKLQKFLEALLRRFGRGQNGHASWDAGSGNGFSPDISNMDFANPTLSHEAFAAENGTETRPVQGDGSTQLTDDWAWREGTNTVMDDSSWAYLEQFLNLPDETL